MRPNTHTVITATVRTAVALLCPLLLISSCDGYEPETEEPKAVIEGTFDSGGYPVVLFSSSVSPGVDGSIKDNVINWGKVTISDGNEEVILSGRVDDGYLPPFKYYTRGMTGVPGRKYRITAKYNNLYAESECVMPFPTEIDRIQLTATDNDTLLAATLFFTSPADTPAYYYLTMSDTQTRTPARPCMMGTICADKPGIEYSMAVMRPKSKIEDKKYIPHLEKGGIYNICLNRVTKEVYDFWRAYDNMVMFSSSPFLSADQSLPSNITGGYGVWSPQGTSSMTVTAE